MAKINLKDFLVKQTINGIRPNGPVNDFVCLPSKLNLLDTQQSIASDYIISKKAKTSKDSAKNANFATTPVLISDTKANSKKICLLSEDGKEHYTFVSLAQNTSIRPKICLDVKKVLAHQNDLNLSIASVDESYNYNDNYSTYSNHTFHILYFGFYPQSIVSGDLEAELNNVFEYYTDPILISQNMQGIQHQAIRPTGRSYPALSKKSLAFDLEYEYNGERYVRAKNYRATNNPFAKKVHFSNGANATKIRKDTNNYIWFKVEPIEWVILNWNMLPKELNKDGSGRDNVIELVAKNAILSNVPFAKSLKDDDKHLWQSSLVRAYLNGYDLNEEYNSYTSYTGIKVYRPNFIYNFETRSNFISEAFDYEIEKRNEKQKINEGENNNMSTNKITRLSKLTGENKPEFTREMTYLETIKTWINYGESVLLRGPSGVGKTTMLQNEYKDRLIRLKLTDNMFPEKVVGSLNLQTGEEIPPNFARHLISMCATEEEKKQMKNDIQNIYAVADTVYKRSKSTDEKVVLMLDELLNVSPQVQSLVYSVVLERLIEIGGGLHLPKNTVIVATGNQQKFSTSSYELASPLEKRFYHILDIEPRVGEWLQEYAIPNGIHPSIIGYMYYKYNETSQSEKLEDIGYFYEDISVGDEHLDKFGSRGKTNDPRNWEQVSHFLTNFENSLSKGELKDIDVSAFLKQSLLSMLREEWAEGFFDFYNEPVLTVEDVISNNYSQDEIPHTLNEKFAQVSMLLSANAEQVKVCREFIYQTCGAEFLRSYDISWIGNDEKRAEIIYELGSDFKKDLVIEEQKAEQPAIPQVPGYVMDFDSFLEENEHGNKIAIACDNKQDALTLTDAFRIAGKVWADGSSYVDPKYNAHKNDSCYLNDGTLESVDTCMSQNIKIIHFRNIDLSAYDYSDCKITLDEFASSSDKMAVASSSSDALKFARALDSACLFGSKENAKHVAPFYINVYTNTGNHFICDSYSEPSGFYYYPLKDIDISRYINSPYKITIDYFFKKAELGEQCAIECSNAKQVTFLCRLFDSMGKTLKSNPSYLNSDSYLTIKDRDNIICMSNDGLYDYNYVPSKLDQNCTKYQFDDVDFRKYTRPNHAKIKIEDWLKGSDKSIVCVTPSTIDSFCDILNTYYKKQVIDPSLYNNCLFNEKYFDRLGTEVTNPKQTHIILPFENLDTSSFKTITLFDFLANRDELAIHINSPAEAEILIKAIREFYKVNNNININDNSQIYSNIDTSYLSDVYCISNNCSQKHDGLRLGLAYKRACIDNNIPVYEFERVNFGRYIKFLNGIKLKKLIASKEPNDKKENKKKQTSKEKELK